MIVGFYMNQNGSMIDIMIFKVSILGRQYINKVKF